MQDVLDMATKANDEGVALCRQKRYAEALACFDEAIKLCPNSARAYSNKGNAYKEMGMRQEAIACYEKAISIDREYAVAYHNLGVLYKEEGNLSKAVPLLKKGLKLEGQQAMLGANNGAGRTMRACLLVGGFLLAMALILLTRRS